jgi:phage shock protein PspC (stress-responsive transcriptional regulator)
MTCPYCRTENHPAAVKCAACASWMVPAPPVREWHRAREGKLLAGVCRGIADRFGVPVAALRLVLILSVVLGGWGLLVYAALWLAMPLAPVPPALLQPPAAAQPPAPPHPPPATA